MAKFWRVEKTYEQPPTFCQLCVVPKAFLGTFPPGCVFTPLLPAVFSPADSLEILLKVPTKNPLDFNPYESMRNRTSNPPSHEIARNSSI